MRRDREEARAKGLDQVELEDKDFFVFFKAMAEDHEKDLLLQTEEIEEEE